MRIIEFYTEENSDIKTLEDKFYTIGRTRRKIDYIDASPVFALSYDPKSGWVQIVIDDNVSESDLEKIREEVSKIQKNNKYKEQWYNDEELEHRFVAKIRIKKPIKIENTQVYTEEVEEEVESVLIPPRSI